MRTRINNGKEQIFCEWRRRWVRLTPEEWVRQQLLHRMVDQLGYPASLIAVEVPLAMNQCENAQMSKAYRADAVVYATSAISQVRPASAVSCQPLMIIECKAETVPLTQRTLDQALTYNRQLNVPHLLLHNGLQSIFLSIPSDFNFQLSTFNSLGNNHQSSGIPRYADLLRGQ